MFALRNGRRLRIRPLRRGGERPIRELYANLSTRARYLRFSSAAPDPPPSVVRLLASVDYYRRPALIAELDGPATRCMVGLADFAVTGDGAAEIGLVVRDDCQRQGIGSALARRVLRAAEDRGVTRFIAHVHPENRVVLALLKRIADVAGTKVSRGVVELAFSRRREERGGTRSGGKR